MLNINLTFIITIISFIIFLFIIKTILYAPISKVIEEREDFLADNLKKENELKDKTKALLEEKENAIKDTRSKATNVLREIAQNTTNENEARINRIKKEAIKRVEQNQQDLDEQKTEVKSEVKSEIKDIVNMMVTKVLGHDIEISLEEEKIKEHLNI